MPRRLFIAADISEEARRLASGLISDLRSDRSVKGVSWVRPENLHVTIKFLGDTDEETEAKLIETLDRITSTYSPFKLHLAKPEILGKRVISIAVRSDTTTVFSLEMVIDTECERLGFKREGRRFHPHITIARIRDPRGTNGLVSQFLTRPVEPVEFVVREIVLYESEMTQAGSEYSKIKTFILKT